MAYRQATGELARAQTTCYMTCRDPVRSEGLQLYSSWSDFLINMTH